MKCPTCGDAAGKPAVIRCRDCGATWALRCQHEPANFSNTGTATYYDPNSGVDITFPYHVCRLCGVFYTDLEAVAAGEKKCQEAQET